MPACLKDRPSLTGNLSGMAFNNQLYNKLTFFRGLVKIMLCGYAEIQTQIMHRIHYSWLRGLAANT